jgi:hypothetical protein
VDPIDGAGAVTGNNVLHDVIEVLPGSLGLLLPTTVVPDGTG